MKLIRDKYVNKIPAEQLMLGVRGTYLEMYLERKLDEELLELHHSDYMDVEEFADVIEVLLAIAATRGITKEQIEEVRLDKLDRLGGFENGIILKD